jgi:hypothetical protein
MSGKVARSKAEAIVRKLLYFPCKETEVGKKKEMSQDHVQRRESVEVMKKRRGFCHQPSVIIPLATKASESEISKSGDLNRGNIQWPEYLTLRL